MIHDEKYEKLARESWRHVTQFRPGKKLSICIYCELPYPAQGPDACEKRIALALKRVALEAKIEDWLEPRDEFRLTALRKRLEELNARHT